MAAQPEAPAPQGRRQDIGQHSLVLALRLVRQAGAHLHPLAWALSAVIHSSRSISTASISAAPTWQRRWPDAGYSQSMYARALRCPCQQSSANTYVSSGACLFKRQPGSANDALRTVPVARASQRDQSAVIRPAQTGWVSCAQSRSTECHLADFAARKNPAPPSNAGILRTGFGGKHATTGCAASHRWARACRAPKQCLFGIGLRIGVFSRNTERIQRIQRLSSELRPGLAGTSDSVHAWLRASHTDEGRGMRALQVVQTHGNLSAGAATATLQDSGYWCHRP